MILGYGLDCAVAGSKDGITKYYRSSAVISYLSYLAYLSYLISTIKPWPVLPLNYLVSLSVFSVDSRIK